MSWYQGIIFVIFVLVCVSATSIAKTKIVLSEDRGTLSTPLWPDQPMHVEFVIKARAGRRISVRFNILDLDPSNGDMLLIQDGRNSDKYHIYNRLDDGSIQKSVEFKRKSGRRKRTVEEPVLFHSTTKRLIITYYTTNSGRRAGVNATYETYPNNLCRISELNTEDSTPNCDRLDIAPMATRCSYSESCRENYEPRGSAVCLNRKWVDNTECLPNATLVEQCQFNETGITNCSFSWKELAEFYSKTVESVAISTSEGGFARSVMASSYTCPDFICNHANGKFTLVCGHAYAGNIQVFTYFYSRTQWGEVTPRPLSVTIPDVHEPSRLLSKS